VCGCDNVTYWNASVAAHDFGANVAATGECPKTTAAKCNATNLACDGNRTCSFELGAASQCAIGTATVGSCWGLPATCPNQSPKYSRCGSGKCLTHCEAIQAENPYFQSSSCP
jgi:hypothetical protein